MRRFRWPLILALITAALAVSGCAAGNSASGSKTLVIYSADPVDTAYYNKVDAQFEKANHVTIKLVAYPSNSFMPSYDAAITGHAQLNMLLANGQNIAFMHQHAQLLSLSGAVKTSSFQSSMIQPFYFNNQLYGAPVGTFSTSAVIYNKTLLAQYSLTPPTTFQQVIADGKVLSAHGDSVFATAGGDIYLWPIWFMQTLQQTTNGHPEQTTEGTVNTGNPSFTAAPYEQAMDALAELGKAPGVFEPGVNGVSETAAVSLFDAGKAAMMYAGSWDYEPATAGAKFPVGMEQFPTYISGSPAGAAGGPSIVAAIYSGSPTADLPVERKWVQYISSPAVDKELVTMESSSATEGAPLPVDPGVQVNAANGNSQVTSIDRQTISQFGPLTFTFLDWTWPATVTTAIQNDIQAVVGGAMTPQAALANIQATSNQASSS